MTATADGIPTMLECPYVVSSRAFTLERRAIFKCVRAGIVQWKQVEDFQLIIPVIHVDTAKIVLRRKDVLLL